MKGIYALAFVLLVAAFGGAAASVLNVNFDQGSHTISPLLWGIFFEEINHAGKF